MGRNKFESPRHPEDCSDKDCTCGGHNASNPKSNLGHHGTLMRWFHRQLRRWKRRQDGSDTR